MLSQRMKARQNLLVAAVNVALERRLITWKREPIDDAVFDFHLAGLPVHAHIKDTCGEVFVTVMVCPTTAGRRSASALESRRRVADCAEAYAQGFGAPPWPIS